MFNRKRVQELEAKVDTLYDELQRAKDDKFLALQDMQAQKQEAINEVRAIYEREMEELRHDNRRLREKMFQKEEGTLSRLEHMKTQQSIDSLAKEWEEKGPPKHAIEADSLWSEFEEVHGMRGDELEPLTQEEVTSLVTDFWGNIES